jgi:SAM-dependent methyltransferase
MPDVYVRVTEAASPILEGLMAALELRAADPQLGAMLTTYLTDAALPRGARVLEVGCGTGAITRIIAKWPGVSAAVGVDPSPVFVARARELALDHASLTFDTADGRSLPFDAASFDAVVFHTTLCHVPEPQVMLGEAVRILRPGGCVAVFEGDYATATLATRAGDRLEAGADAFREHFVHDPGWCGGCPRWYARQVSGSSPSAATATSRPSHRDSCSAAGSTWERTRSSLRAVPPPARRLS